MSRLLGSMRMITIFRRAYTRSVMEMSREELIDALFIAEREKNEALLKAAQWRERFNFLDHVVSPCSARSLLEHFRLKMQLNGKGSRAKTYKPIVNKPEFAECLKKGGISPEDVHEKLAKMYAKFNKKIHTMVRDPKTNKLFLEERFIEPEEKKISECIGKLLDEVIEWKAFPRFESEE